MAHLDARALALQLGRLTIPRPLSIPFHPFPSFSAVPRAEQSSSRRLWPRWQRWKVAKFVPRSLRRDENKVSRQLQGLIKLANLCFFALSFRSSRWSESKDMKFSALVEWFSAGIWENNQFISVSRIISRCSSSAPCLSGKSAWNRIWMYLDDPLRNTIATYTIGRRSKCDVSPAGSHSTQADRNWTLIAIGCQKNQPLCHLLKVFFPFLFYFNEGTHLCKSRKHDLVRRVCRRKFRVRYRQLADYISYRL